MKKIIYLAPLALLGIGAKASANQVSTHISNALRIYEQENQPVGQSENEQGTQQAEPTFPNSQNQPVGKVGETTDISRLDSGLLNGDSSVGNEQASQVMKISRIAIPIKQELNESKESVAGQYVQVQQNRVAQFNKGSKIYGLNNSDQLSKNNGNGYVITNAGTYNGRAVDIGVTINNVQDNQGSYTTKWSNGDKADVTGKTDANFKYQDSVLLNQQVTDPNLTQTRPRIETQNVQNQLNGVWIRYNEDYSVGGVDQNRYAPTLIDPKLIADTMTLLKCDEPHAVYALLTSNIITQGGINLGNYNYFLKRKWNYHYTDDFGPYANTKYFKADRGFYDDDTSSQSFDNPWYDVGRSKFIHYNLVQPNVTVTSNNFGSMFWRNSVVIGEVITGTVAKDKKGKLIATQLEIVYSDLNADETSANKINSILSHISSNGYKFTMSNDVQVTDHLQVDSSTLASLGYNYTVGLYDAQTGELIKDLTTNYKGKTGKTATDQDTAMNDKIKAKIQAINADTANSAYTGTIANDDVAFSKNTVHVNYVDEHGQPIDVPGYDIDVDNLTSGNYQVPQNYVLVNANGFKVTKNTHEVNDVTVTDSYNFIDQGNNKVTDNGRTLSVVLTHGTTNVGPDHSGLSNDATANTFIINNGAKKQINSQSRHFGASGILDLVTNKVTMQGDWQLSGKPNFDQTNINNDLVGYGNAIHSNLTFLTL